MIERIYTKFPIAIIAAAALLSLSACDRGGEGKTSMAGNYAGSTQSADTTAEQTAPTTDPAPGAVANTAPNSGADTAITASVRAALARDPDSPLAEIDVAAVNGKVSLRGTVPTQAAHDRAVQLAGTVGGVRGIDDQLSVQPQGG